MAQESPFVRFLIIAAAFVVVVAGMKAAESLLVPFLLSLFIAVLCSPSLAWLNKRGLPNGVSLLIIISVIVGGGFMVGAVVGSSLNDFRDDLPLYQEKLQGQSEQLLAWLSSKGVTLDEDQWRDMVNPSAAMNMAGNTLASFGNVMTNAFMILLTVIFILAEEVRFTDKLRFGMNSDNLVPEEELGTERTMDALGRFSLSVNRYMAIKLGLSLLTGGLIFFWLLFLDVRYPVLWGLLAFLLNFVPTLGSILAAIPAVLLALVQLGLGDAALVGLGYLVVNVVVGNALEPRIMGKGLNLSALVVFLSLVFWGWVLGPVGMLLSVPLTVMVKIALESFDDTRWISVMLGSGKGDT
ncbi:AI-2E family transporter [Maricurvus nonylphenolicus]|uniref:AI-2E family transporter n=1 Tax=Maricurvus nonylphenolicus TaxID=1008307 RepID=UPI0036F264F5